MSRTLIKILLLYTNWALRSPRRFVLFRSLSPSQSNSHLISWLCMFCRSQVLSQPASLTLFEIISDETPRQPHRKIGTGKASRAGGIGNGRKGIRKLGTNFRFLVPPLATESVLLTTTTMGIAPQQTALFVIVLVVVGPLCVLGEGREGGV